MLLDSGVEVETDWPNRNAERVVAIPTAIAKKSFLLGIFADKSDRAAADTLGF
jgi:hypothetical protein